MPIYEYRCKKRHTFEVMQRMSDDAVKDCQVCGAPVERVFHPIAVHFKGSGFYSTDYGSKKRSRELKEAGEGKGKHAKDGDSGSASSSEGKSETKSEGKAEGKSEGATSTATKSGSKGSSSGSSSD